MKFCLTFSLLLVCCAVSAQRYCTIYKADTDAGRDFCDICSAVTDGGTEPAIQNGVFSGTLRVDSDGSPFTVTEACLSAITFAGDVTIINTAKTQIHFATEPTFAPDANIAVNYEGNINNQYIYVGTTAYRPTQQPLTYADLTAHWNAVAAATLPVSLIHWSATLTGKGTALQWSTGGETGHAAFIIMYSTDGQHFRELTRQPGSPDLSAGRTYSFQHRHVRKGMHYYRLLQEDADGSLTYYPLLHVERGPRFHGTGGRIYPNPATAGTAVHYTPPPVPTYALLHDMSGKVVLRQPAGPAIGGILELPPSLAPGAYVLRIGRESQRLVVR